MKVLLLLIIVLLPSCGVEKSVRNERDNPVPGSFKSLQIWNDVRSYPNHDIKSEGFERAFNNLQKNKNSPKLNSSPLPWRSIGPKNIGGRMLCLTFNPENPNSVWSGSASGGIWKSSSAALGNEAWEKVPTGFPTLGVMTIAFAPGDSMTIYAGTGEVYNVGKPENGAAYRPTRGSYGIGILKSTDGGNSWTKSLDYSKSQGRGINMLKVNPNDKDEIWAATSHGLLISEDSGNSWINVLNYQNATDIEFDPNNKNKVYASFGNFNSEGNGIYETTNDGSSWDKLTGDGSGFISEFGGKILMDISSQGMLWASVGNDINPYGNTKSWVYNSNDQGESWNLKFDGDHAKYQGWYSHDVAVSPFDENEISIIGIQAFISHNGGNSFEQNSEMDYLPGRFEPMEDENAFNYIHSDIHAVSYHPINEGTIYYAGDGGIFKSTNGGVNIRDYNGGLQTTQFYQGFSNSQMDKEFALGGMQDNGTALYLGDDYWFYWANGGDGSWSGIDERGGKERIYMSSQNLGIVWSDDRSKTKKRWNFEKIPVPPSEIEAGFIAPFIVDKSEENSYIAGGDYVLQYNTYDESWNILNYEQPLNDNVIYTMAQHDLNTDIIYCATSSSEDYTKRPEIFVTINKQEFTNITNNLPNRYITDIALGKENDSLVYVTLGGYGTAHVYKSTNRGVFWEEFSEGLPDLPTSAIMIDPLLPDVLYVGNDLGVFYLDEDEIWYPLLEGLPEAVIVTDITFSNNLMRVSTHGNGVWERELLSVDILAGVKDEIAHNINIIINQDELIIDFDKLFDNQYNIQIVDISGNILINQEIIKNNKINISNLRNEVFVYNISKNGTAIKSGKFVK
jgi:hypothetical protein